jgi:hypothetical protein
MDEQAYRMLQLHLSKKCWRTMITAEVEMLRKYR